MGIPAIVAIYKGKWWWIGGFQFQHISSKILHHGIHFDQAVSKSALANSSTQRSAWHAWLQIKWSWQLFAMQGLDFDWQMLAICVLQLGPSCQNRHSSPIGPFLIGSYIISGVGWSDHHHPSPNYSGRLLDISSYVPSMIHALIVAITSPQDRRCPGCSQPVATRFAKEPVRQHTTSAANDILDLHWFGSQSSKTDGAIGALIII